MKLYENKNECCGCFACANICPKGAVTMVADNEGFKYPQIDDSKCVSCKLCEKVCPIKSSKELADAEKSRKHIGIINLQHTPNYGAVIAAAVLEDVVRNFVGDDYIVNTIDYRAERDFGNKFLNWKDQAKQWGGWKNYIHVLFPQKRKVSKPSFRGRRFNIYKDNFLNLTPPHKEARDINKDINYSAFITGSDVVWATKRTDDFRSEGYYLKFADKGEKRIAYAPSLDNKVDKKLIALSDCYRENLKYLDCISVRESSNVDFVQKLTDKKVYHCCDPALLVEPSYYDKMLDTADVERSNDKYIYVYILETNREIVEYANKLAKEKGMKIYYYSFNHSDYNDGSFDCVGDGPAEFLYRLRNAEYVLTNSFHCVVFSILFKKKFLSFFRTNISIKSSDLLKDFGLSNRIVTPGNSVDIDEDIDFDKVEETLKSIRQESLDYLKDALKDIK